MSNPEEPKSTSDGLDEDLLDEVAGGVRLSLGMGGSSGKCYEGDDNVPQNCMFS